MKRARVLLADDHRLVAEGLKSILAAEFDVAGVVADGRALILAAKALRPDVIVSDVTMPELNGIEALEELKKHGPRRPGEYFSLCIATSRTRDAR